MNKSNILNPYNTWKYCILTLTFKAIFHKNFPSHLKLHLQPHTAFNLRSDTSIKLPSIISSNSFSSIASTFFNELPPKIRKNCLHQSLHQFSCTVKNYLLQLLNFLHFYSIFIFIPTISFYLYTITFKLGSTATTPIINHM